jgi:hypothetical protein
MKIRHTKSFIGILSLLLFLITPPLVGYAESPPRTMNYQGYLTNSAGEPVNATVVMSFFIYDVPTGGSVLWNETHNNVTVQGGVYSVILGEITPLTLAFDKPYYLGIEVNGDGEMSPRQPLTSVPYALEKYRPIIWSGSAITSGCPTVGASGWYTYPTDGPDYFCNADGYFSVDANGTITFQTRGFYRINAYTGSFCSSNSGSQVRILLHQDGSPDVPIYAGTQSNCREENIYWSIDLTWPFEVGDSIELQFYSTGSGAQPYCGGKLQITYVGLLPS